MDGIADINQFHDGFVKIKYNATTWYLTLNRSQLTPPNYIFSIVWSFLYCLLAISGWLIWQSKPFVNLPLLKKLFIAQLILNWSWTPLFFTYHLIDLALICLALIVILVVILIIKSYKNLIAVSLMLGPYLLWLLLASYLNFYIWQYN